MTHSLPRLRRLNGTSVQLLTQFGRDHGLSIEQCLADTRLNWRLLAEPGAEVEAQQELQLIRNLVRHLGHIPGIGLQAGLRYRLSSYGIWGFALLSSPNYRSAIQLGLRYLDLTCVFHRIQFEEQGREAILTYDDREVPDDLKLFVLERDIAGALSMQRDLTNSVLPLFSAQFRVPQPADTSPYQALLGITPLFGAAENRVAFARALLDLPLPGANSSVARQCEQECQALVARQRACDGLAGRVRDGFLAKPGQVPDMEMIAAELHMTSRTLRRRLEAEGTSFRQLQDEVRQVLAEELLSATSLNMEEIAERLGYGDVSNFLRAFKRWKGQSPGSYRLQSRG